MKFVYQKDKYVNVGKELYISKEKRDSRAKELKAKGYFVDRGSSRNQQLHPEHITDTNFHYETGFGNTAYQMVWSVLYKVEWFEERFVC